MHITVQKSGRVMTTLALERGPALIGSDPSVSIRLDSPTIPKRQAILLSNSRGFWFLEDLGSGGRTLLNGNPARRARLSAGDRIDIGQFRLIIGSDQDDSQLSPVRPTAKLPELPESAVVRYPEDAVSVRTATAGNLQDLTTRLFLIDNQQEMLKEILDCLLAIFDSANAWIGLRTDMKAPIAISTGKSRSGRALDEGSLPPVLLERALEHDHAVLIPKVSDLSRRGLKIFRAGRAGSAMSCPVCTPKGTIGVRVGKRDRYVDRVRRVGCRVQQFRPIGRIVQSSDDDIPARLVGKIQLNADLSTGGRIGLNEPAALVAGRTRFGRQRVPGALQRTFGLIQHGGPCQGGRICRALQIGVCRTKIAEIDRAG